MDNLSVAFRFITDPVWIVFAIVAYLLAAIPMGLLVARLFGGIDIRQTGSGNIGMTNVMRTVGKKAGILTFVLDFLKAYLPTIVYDFQYSGDNPLSVYLLGIVAVFGHTRSVFMGFRGGKGVACLFAVLCAWSPVGMLVMGGLWLTVYKLTGISSLGGMLVAVLSLLVTYFLWGIGHELAVHGLLSLYILALHRKNIIRLLEGEELAMKKKDS